MPSIVETDFGANTDGLVDEVAVFGPTTGTLIGVVNSTEYRARSIRAGNAGAVINGIYATYRNGAWGTTTPAAGQFNILVIISAQPITTTQSFATRAAVQAFGGTVALNRSHSTLSDVAIEPAGGIYVPSGMIAHVIAGTACDQAAGNPIACFIDLTVVGQQLQDKALAGVVLR